jgi:hypothetical protein
MPLRPGSRDGFFQGYGVCVTDIHEFDLLGMFLYCIEMIIGNTTAANDGEPNLPVNDYWVDVH